MKCILHTWNPLLCTIQGRPHKLVLSRLKAVRPEKNRQMSIKIAQK